MIYKLKHVPTGLYYQPHKHRGSHLSKKGKIYQTKTHGLSYAIKEKREIFRVQCGKDSNVYKQTKDVINYVKCTYHYNQMVGETKVSDWVIEEL